MKDIKENNIIFLKNNSGQLLVELLISLVVGGLFLVVATMAVVSLIRYNFESHTGESASFNNSEISNFIEQIAYSDWDSISGVSVQNYFIIPSGSTSTFIRGKESVLTDDITYGLVGMWKFDEGATTTAYDSSGNMFTATTTGSPVKKTSSCAMSYCLTMNGDDYVDPGNPSELRITGAITVSAWINPTSHGSGSTVNPSIISKSGNGTGKSWDFHIENALDKSGEVEFAISPDGSTEKSAYSLSPVTTGTWAHYVGVYSPSSYVRVYKNGVLEGENTSSIPASQSNLALTVRIGSRNECTDCFFDGHIDDVRVYNRALSADEVSQLYNSRVQTRYFSVGGVYRDSSGDITESTSTGTLDPSTIKIDSTIVTDESKTLLYRQYVTRTSSSTVFSQTSWSGGSGIEGPVTTTPTGYSSSSNVTATTSITLSTTTASGWLESTTYDTQDTRGMAMQSVFWRGTLPSGAVVKFQVAGSDSSSGPWSYIGSDGTSGTYFTPSSQNVQTTIYNLYGYQYFRYKIFLEPNAGNIPSVSDVYISWTR